MGGGADPSRGQEASQRLEHGAKWTPVFAGQTIDFLVVFVLKSPDYIEGSVFSRWNASICGCLAEHTKDLYELG